MKYCITAAVTLCCLCLVGCSYTKKQPISGSEARSVAAQEVEHYCGSTSTSPSRLRLALAYKSTTRTDGSWNWLFSYDCLDAPYQAFLVKITHLGDVRTRVAPGRRQAQAAAEPEFARFVGIKGWSVSEFGPARVQRTVLDSENEQIWYYERRRLVGKQYTVSVSVYESGDAKAFGWE